ncbi:protein ITPRID2 isoform X2 [Thalassophryne amazonica]|nr:protein ITPRID2 isoform X2 [Thalassophryne amazonica]
MNSTGSGKSSTVSSVSELLDLYEEDPEEILLNLGFGQEEPHLASKIPSRFFNSSSSARGIDIKVYLGAQMQRMELENPNYALTSRFRQIEVLTTVANEFFQLYSQVSGQPVQRITSRDQGGEDGGGAPPLKKSSSALNAAKLLKRSITKHNLLGGANESQKKPTVQQHAHAEQGHAHAEQGHAHAEQGHAHAEQGHAHAEQGHAHAEHGHDTCTTNSDYQAETASQTNIRKRDICSLATVAEETVGVGETDRSTDKSATPTSSGEPQPQSADVQPSSHTTEEVTLISSSQKAPPTLSPAKLCLLRTENTDSFDMEEVQSNEGDVLPARVLGDSGLLRTTSQQSDSSGFAEEPSTDTSSFLQVQESSDSCDSETTVTSHSSQDTATPLALDQPAFELLVSREKEAEPGATAEGRCSSTGREELGQMSEAVPHYSVHQLPLRAPVGSEQHKVQNGLTDPESAESLRTRYPSELLDQSAPKQEPEHGHKLIMEAADANVPTGGSGDPFQDTDRPGLSDPSSLVLSALNRAKQKLQQVDSRPVETAQLLGRGKARGSLPLQRSSSLPTSLLSPSSVVSSVRIEFGQGQTSCTPPRYSYKYSQEDGDQEEIKERQANHLSTLIINPASSTSNNDQLTEPPSPPRSLPHYLLQSPCTLQSPGPSPDWTRGGHTPSWSTQSVPDVSSNQQQPPHIQQNMTAFQIQHGWKMGHMLPYGGTTQSLNPSPNPCFYPNPSFNQHFYPQTRFDPSYLHPCFEFNPTSFLNPTPNPNCSLNHSLYPNPNRLSLHSSLPNIFDLHNPSQTRHSSLTSLYPPPAPVCPQHRSLSNFQQPPPCSGSQHVSMGAVHPLPGTPVMHQHCYSQSPYHAAPHTSHYAPSNLGYHGYALPPHQAFSYPATQHPLLSPERCSPAPGSSPGSSSTEMQLRKVLHDIRGTVLGLNQNRPDTLAVFSDHRAALPRHQSLMELQQKRRSLSLFRSHMMNLELSIMQQQALVYKHLSPADRLEAEQLQSLRSEVREELQELEQQLDDKLMELTQSTGLHRDGSVDSLSTTSALRAMEPVSDLLQEQLLLQSELSCSDHAPSTGVSSQSSSTVSKGGDGEMKQAVYRASINITPAPPARPNTVTKEDQDGAVGGVMENLQDLIREIRESVAHDVRQEIYNEMLAAVSPRRSLL